MDNHIVGPPKLYIDTNHLVNIARLRSGERCDFREAYAFIDECITSRHFGVVFSDFAALEWIAGRATEQSAQEIAAVVDSAKLQYRLEGDAFVYTSEVLAECSRQNANIRVPALPVLQVRIPDGTVHSSLGMLAQEVPGFLQDDDRPAHLQGEIPPAEVPVLPAAKYVAGAVRFKE